MAAIKGKKLDRLSCPVCNEQTGARITALEKHVGDTHNMTLQQLWDKLHGGPVKCRCGCGQATTWYGWKTGYSEFIIGHNGSIYSAYDEATAKSISEKRSRALEGQSGWSKGLSKESDLRIAKRAIATSIGRKKSFDKGKIVAWNKGLTKESDERVALAAESTKESFTSGKRVAWQKGKTEQTDDRIKQKNDDLRRRYERGELKAWHKGKTAEEDPRISKFWENRDAQSEYAHIRFSSEKLQEMLANNRVLNIVSSDSYKNANKPSLLVNCKSCGWQEFVTLPFAKNDRCPICSPKGSAGQNQIADWLENTHGISVGRNVAGIIGKYELDIYVPEYSIAIEFNGLYWHNDKSNKRASYHQDKTNACRAIGMSLIHVFEDEWRDKQEIVKSMITSQLRKTPNNVHARECSIVELHPKDKKEFFVNNHLDGDTPTTRAWGLADKNGNIVYAISIRNPLHKTLEKTIEIARFCPKIFYNVPGGMTKLLSALRTHALENEYERILSYVDTRHGGDGKGYLNAGFTKISTTPPRFWWTDNHSRFNRFRFRADKSRNLTEAQVAEEAGITKIWGCENFVYALDLVQRSL